VHPTVSLFLSLPFVIAIPSLFFRYNFYYFNKINPPPLSSQANRASTSSPCSRPTSSRSRRSSTAPCTTQRVQVQCHARRGVYGQGRRGRGWDEDWWVVLFAVSRSPCLPIHSRAGGAERRFAPLPYVPRVRSFAPPPRFAVFYPPTRPFLCVRLSLRPAFVTRVLLPFRSAVHLLPSYRPSRCPSSSSHCILPSLLFLPFPLLAFNHSH
jgi:hypothetical protein